MTRTEQKDMAELGITPEKLAAKQQELAAIIDARPVIEMFAAAPQEPARTRKPRSDKGKPKPKKAAPPTPAPPDEGKLRPVQAVRLTVLLNDLIDADRIYWAADVRRAKAGIAYNAYLDSLTAR